MPENKAQKAGFDWRVTSFEGARREQLRRWAELPLENTLLAIEEMQEVVQLLYHTLTGKRCESAGCEKTPDSIFTTQEESGLA